MQIHNCEQGTPEWFEARRGIPTASMFQTVMAKGRGGKGKSLTRDKYLKQLAGEIITGKPMENFSNGYMERGHEVEGEARDMYEFMCDATVEQVGFIRTEFAGCSPDGLVGDDGLVEIKSKAPHILIDVLLKGEVPPEHEAQIQGAMLVSGRKWLDFIAYFPGMPIFIKRVERDEDYITNLQTELEQFNAELAEIVEKVSSVGEAA